MIENLSTELELYRKPKDDEAEKKRLAEEAAAAKNKPAPAKPGGKEVPSNKPAAPKFEEGKVYTDAKGNKAKYVNGKWEPQ